MMKIKNELESERMKKLEEKEKNAKLQLEYNQM